MSKHHPYFPQDNTQAGVKLLYYVFVWERMQHRAYTIDGLQVGSLSLLLRKKYCAKFGIPDV